jgi:hypothetical protein
MAEETGPLVLTSIEVETATGEQKLKTFEGKVDASAAKIKASLATIDKTGGPLANTLDNAAASATKLGGTADGLGPLRDLLNQSKTSGAAFESQMASLGATSKVAAAETITGLGAIGLGLGGIAVAAGVTAIGLNFALDAMSDFAAAAGPITQLTRGFETLTTRVGETGDAFLSKMRPATQGLVSDLELMKATNRALLLDLPVTSETMAELAGGAVKLGRAMGVDAVKSVDSLIEGIGRQSPRLLDNIGIIVRAKEVYADYAKEIGTTSDQLTEQERKLAFTTAALESVRQKTQDLTDETPAFSEQWQRAAVATDNARTSILQLADEALGRAVIAFGHGELAAIEFGGKVVDTAAQGVQSIGSFGVVTKRTMEDSATSTGVFATALLQLAPPIQSAIDLMGKLGLLSKSTMDDAAAAAKTIHEARGPADLTPDERRSEKLSEDLKETAQKLTDARANAAELTRMLHETNDVDMQKLISVALKGVNNELDQMLGKAKETKLTLDQIADRDFRAGKHLPGARPDEPTLIPSSPTEGELQFLRDLDKALVQAIDDAQNLDDALFDLAQAKTENALQAATPVQIDLFGGDATAGKHDQELAAQRLEIMQASLADEALARYNSIQAEYDREILLGDNLVLAEQQRNTKMLTLRQQLSTKSTELIRESQRAQAAIYQANFNVQMAGIQAVAGAAGGAISSVFGQTKSGQKAAAIVNAAAAVVSALANIPYPYNFVVAAITTAAAQVQIAKINSTNIGSGGEASFSSPGGAAVDYSGAVKTPGGAPVTGTTPVVANPTAPTPAATEPGNATIPPSTQPRATQRVPPTPVPTPVAAQTNASVETYNINFNVSTIDAAGFKEFLAGRSVRRMLVEAVDVYRERR